MVCMQLLHRVLLGCQHWGLLYVFCSVEPSQQHCMKHELSASIKAPVCVEYSHVCVLYDLVCMTPTDIQQQAQVVAR